MTFLEAYECTHRVINITVAGTRRHEMPQLLNYLTAPNVLIWSACVASCASPFLYAPADLLALDASGNAVPWSSSRNKWSGGSLESNLPMDRLRELFNINHFIVSQVNPHVLPFMPETKKKSWRYAGYVDALKRFILGELHHRLIQLAELGLFPRFMQPLITQRYDGDITIVPDLRFPDVLRILNNPKYGGIAVAARPVRESATEQPFTGPRARRPSVTVAVYAVRCAPQRARFANVHPPGRARHLALSVDHTEPAQGRADAGTVPAAGAQPLRRARRCRGAACGATTELLHRVRLEDDADRSEWNATTVPLGERSVRCR